MATRVSDLRPILESVGDHSALDLMNTVYQADGEPVDSWQTDADVLDWLNRAGWLEDQSPPSFKQAALLTTARQLRELVRTLVMRRKDARPLDIAALNAFLAHARRHLALVKSKDGGFVVTARYESSTPEQLLAPVAEAAAQLLAEGDFNLVRKCESKDCSLWFYDRTKGHRRRWCSMAVCGNRHKVASFRQRQAAA